MTSSLQFAERETFSLVVSRGTEILMSRLGTHLTLPTITIPKRQRTARCITEGLLDTWNLKTVCLFQSDTHEDRESSNAQYVILESRDPRWQPPDELEWVARDVLVSDSVRDAQLLHEILECADSYNDRTLPGPFARVGWVDELLLWAQDHVSGRGLRLTGEFRQFNCDPLFALVRLETSGPALWFKAVGKPNLQEYSITLGLAQNHPKYFPAILAVKPEWNGWLMLEVASERLDHRTGLEQWSRVAEAFAHLQCECLGQTQGLLKIGCKDRRTAAIESRIDPFLDVMEGLMQEQPSEPPQRLSRFQLKELGKKLKDACWRVQLSGMPDSLFHGDFNPGNIRLHSETCVFLDWAEGCLGFPFLTLEYLIAFLQSSQIALADYEKAVRRAYVTCWREVVADEQIANAMRLAPLLAVFCHSLSCAAWENPTLLRKRRSAQYLRSLTRRMYKELEQLKSRNFALSS